MSGLTVHHGNKAAIEARKKNAMASRLLLLRLRKFHAGMDIGPARYPVPSKIVGNPLLMAAEDRWRNWKPAGRVTPTVFPTTVPAVATIAEIVCRYYRIQMKDLLGQRRLAKYVRPRQVAMYLAVEMTAKSLIAVGYVLNRDHTTIIHGHRLVEKMIERDAAFEIQVMTIRKQIDVWISLFPEATDPVITTKPERKPRPQEWSEDECRILLELKANGCRGGVIAQRIGRSKRACEEKLSRLREAAHATP